MSYVPSPSDLEALGFRLSGVWHGQQNWVDSELELHIPITADYIGISSNDGQDAVMRFRLPSRQFFEQLLAAIRAGAAIAVPLTH